MKTIENRPCVLCRKDRVLQAMYRGVHTFPFSPTIRRYNLTISEERKFIWFRVAKCGTRTFFDHLKVNEVSLAVEHAYMCYYPEKLYQDYFKFAFVRNPWDRLVSCWRDKVLNGKYFGFSNQEHEKMNSFSAFVHYVAGLDLLTCDNHLRMQSALINLNDVDYVGRMESFDEDAATIFRKIGVQEKQMTRKNVTSAKTDYRSVYTPELVDQVRRLYAKDILLFCYQF